jgi:hypothetical protein
MTIYTEKSLNKLLKKDLIKIILEQQNKQTAETPRIDLSISEPEQTHIYKKRCQTETQTEPDQENQNLIIKAEESTRNYRVLTEIYNKLKRSRDDENNEKIKEPQGLSEERKAQMKNAINKLYSIFKKVQQTKKTEIINSAYPSFNILYDMFK